MTSDSEKKMVVVGAGGIGGITSAYLKKASYDISICDIDKKHVDSINAKGLYIDGVRGEHRIEIEAKTSLEGIYDIVFLSVKSLHTNEALDAIIPHLKPSSLVVSLQNGINEDLIREKIGDHRTIGCVVGWGATNLGPGHLRQTSQGKFIIGRVDGNIDADVKEIKEILDKVTETVITENIFGHLWSKLLINCCIATIGVCFAADVKKLVSNQKIIPIMVALTEELVRVADHAEIQLEKFEDVLDMGLFQIADFNDYKRAVALMKMAGEHHKAIKSSMWQDVEKGRKTEIDFINGYVERKADELGISTPVNKALIQLVKAIENKEKTPSDDNIQSFYDQVRIPKRWIEYDFDDDPRAEFAIFNLPCGYKHRFAVRMTGVQFVGLLTAFSKAFEKLTNSFIGKIFVRKSAWDIVNLVLSKYLQQMGEKFAVNIQKNYNIRDEDIISVGKIFTFFFNIEHVSYQIEKMSKNEFIVFIEKNADTYFQAEQLIGVSNEINIPITLHLLKAMANATCEHSIVEYNEVSFNDKQGYRIRVLLE